MKYIIILLGVVLSSYNLYAQTKLEKKDLEELKSRLEGNYDNNDQSKNDLSFPNAALHITEISLKGKHPEGYWLYVEQGQVSGAEIPERQYVLNLRKGDKTSLILDLYELNEPMRYAGGWTDKSVFAKLRLDSLTERKGCSITLTKNELGNFSGTTMGTDCRAVEDSTQYLIISFNIYNGMLVLSERRFDLSGKEISGAVKEPYKFRKWMTARRED